jgi:cytochrome P450/NADPH-cytochrome P450 reductase
MDNVSQLQPIPRPPGHLFVGNLLDLDASHPIESVMDLARTCGPIFQMTLPGRGSLVVVSGYELVDELCDESRFDKKVGPGLNALAQGPVGRGLFYFRDSGPELA